MAASDRVPVNPHRTSMPVHSRGTCKIDLDDTERLVVPDLPVLGLGQNRGFAGNEPLAPS
jgi:hypothetical protein